MATHLTRIRSHLLMLITAFGLALLAGCGGGGGGGGTGGTGGGTDDGGGDDGGSTPPPPPPTPITLGDITISKVVDGMASVTVESDREGQAMVSAAPVGHNGRCVMVPAAGIELQADSDNEGTLYFSHVGTYRVSITATNGGEPQTYFADVQVPGPGHEVGGEVAPDSSESGALVTDVILDWQPHADLESTRLAATSVTSDEHEFSFTGLATSPESFQVEVQPTVAQ